MQGFAEDEHERVAGDGRQQPLGCQRLDAPVFFEPGNTGFLPGPVEAGLGGGDGFEALLREQGVAQAGWRPGSCSRACSRATISYRLTSKPQNKPYI